MNNDYSNNHELAHVGVLGMKWGRRNGELYRKNTMTSAKRQRDLDNKELSGLEKKKRQSKIDAKKIEILKKRVSAVKSEKLSQQEHSAIIRSRTKKATLAVAALFLLGDMPFVVGHNAKVLGKIYLSQRKYNKYGGFDPKKVVNSHFVENSSNFVNLGKSMLLGGG